MRFIAGLVVAAGLALVAPAFCRRIIHARTRRYLRRNLSIANIVASEASLVLSKSEGVRDSR